MEDILADLSIQVSTELKADPGGEERDNDVNAVMAALERECRQRYRDTGSGIHFVGVLLAVLVAEVVSRWWEHRGGDGDGDQSPRTRGPARMLTCLYSKDRVAFVLSHPDDNQTNLRDKVAKVWGEQSLAAGYAGKETSDFEDLEGIFMASAAIRVTEAGPSGDIQHDIPFFGCPKHFIPDSSTTDPHYVEERFEETDLLPIFAVATAVHTLRQAFDVIFEAHQPQDTSLKSPTGRAIDQNEFPLLEFSRGCGIELNWLSDPALLRNAKLELDSQEALASSKVIGVFGSIIDPHILFQQTTNLGVYSSMTKEFSILSQKNDFFEAGIEFSRLSQPPTPITAEPDFAPETPPSSNPQPIVSEDVSAYLNLPANISLFPIAEPTPATPMVQPTPKTPKQNPPDSPSFFSPSFADHLSSSNRYDPRTHALNFPLHLTTPTRSQSYPTTPSPVRTSHFPSAFSALKSRSQIPSRSARRTSDVPVPNITGINPRELEILRGSRTLLLIDIRAFAAFAKARLVDAINVCIPTVLLKRSSLTLDDISESIVARGDRGRFAKWKEVDGIVIYDSDSLRVKDSYPLTTLATKFIEAGFNGATYGLIGGFASLTETPSLIDSSPLTNLRSPPPSPSTPRFLPNSLPTRLPPSVDATTRLALECKESPLFSRATNNPTHIPGAPAFFSNIRQNMDLHGGVGPVIPINAPSIPPSLQSRLPQWLVDVAYSRGGAQVLAQRWEIIELAEKKRLEGVLTGRGMEGRFSISAAMERGEKNRYPNIWPFEWNRVRVPGARGEGDDYFNGSFIEVDEIAGGRRYIATQAPVPGTFEDFWKVVWGQNVQVIVCLTAVEEGGQTKCHPYWEEATVGDMHVSPIHQTSVSLGLDQNCTMRTLMLQNREDPFVPLREIVQLHYEGWPDFGTPAEAATIVSLVRLLRDVVASRGRPDLAPVLVHCSAGCGRTGTFCTVDSVIYAVDSGMGDGEEDLIYQKVLALREQRMSLVQTLRQYVLCYDCVLYHILSKFNMSSEQEDVQMKMG